MIRGKTCFSLPFFGDLFFDAVTPPSFLIFVFWCFSSVVRRKKRTFLFGLFLFEPSGAADFFAISQYPEATLG
jgi:hypothetical protein